VATVAAAFLLFVPFAGAADSSGMRVTVLKGPVFPERTLVLTFPHSRGLHSRGVRVNENGLPVRHVVVAPASTASKQTFGVVLVLDTSCSMQGKALASARNAEQSFFNARRNPNEAVGVIDFNTSATTVLPLTTSQSEISAALAKTPTIACGTHIFDAVARAERMLREEHIISGSIIVLSDGADTGSKASLATR
jgi:Mg-chelatase subunit ChlD